MNNLEHWWEDHPFPISYMDFSEPSTDLVVPPKDTKRLFYVEGYAAKLILAILKSSGFRPTKSLKDSLLIVGSALGEKDFRALEINQKTNHYQNTFALGSKDGYHDLMRTLEERTKKRFSFYPESYILPKERSKLAQVFQTSNLWIQKPAGGSRGEGIKVIDTPPKTCPVGGVLVQKYISNPLLINGHKFDLRFYVAVPSVDPLRVYLFNNGLVRIATHNYNDHFNDIGDFAAHLTNFSLNKDQEGFVATDDISKDGTGNKWSHVPFWPFLESVGFDSGSIKNKIEKALATIIISASDSFRAQHNNRVSFEIFGFDVMIDQDQNIFVLEANVSPAMGTSSELDRYIKSPLVKDLFNLSLIPEPSNFSQINNMLHCGHISNEDALFYSIVYEHEAALNRAGGFKLIYPTLENISELNTYMTELSTKDLLLQKWIQFDNQEKWTFLNRNITSFSDIF